MKRLADGMPKLRGMLHDLIEAAKPEVLDVEAMGGRMDLPWRPEHAANAVVQTLGDKAAGAAEFAGELRAMGAREWKDRFDRIKAGVPVPEAMERGDNALTFNVFEKYANASSNEREQMERIYVPFTDPRETAAYQWGEEMRNRVREAYPSNPRYEGDFLTDIVPRVFADIAVDAVISRGLGKALGAKEGADQISRLVSVTLEVINESSEAFRNSLKNKESIDEAYKKFGFGVVVGLTGGIPVAELLEEVNKATGGSLSGLLWESAKGGSEEAVILRIQQSLKEAERLGVVDGKEVIAAFASGGVVEFARSLVGAK